MGLRRMQPHLWGFAVQGRDLFRPTGAGADHLIGSSYTSAPISSPSLTCGWQVVQAAITAGTGVAARSTALLSFSPTSS